VAYFPDLSEYSYLGVSAGDAPLINVGWLARGHLFPTSHPPDAALIDALLRLSLRPAELCRGFHVCDICAETTGPLCVEAFGRPIVLGNGEVRVEGDGVVYVAPTLVAHYVAAHEYAPPPAFAAAAIRRAANVRVAPIHVQHEVARLSVEALRARAWRLATRTVAAAPTPWAIEAIEAVRAGRHLGPPPEGDGVHHELLEQLWMLDRYEHDDSESARARQRGRLLEMLEAAMALGVDDTRVDDAERR
jgi:hypothetical protein